MHVETSQEWRRQIEGEAVKQGVICYILGESENKASGKWEEETKKEMKDGTNLNVRHLEKDK